MQLFSATPLLLWLTALLLPVAAIAQEDAPALDSEAKKLSYVIGMDVGASIQRLGPDADIDLDILMRAIEDVLADREMLLSSEQANEVKRAFMVQRRQQLAEQAAEQGAKNQSEGEAFLAENKQREGVVTTDSGLQYEVLEQGDGPKPEASDTVTVNYRGTLIDGTEFDSSYQRGQPATFKVQGVIPGWTEALQLMPVGSKYRLYIPPELAYGARGAGRVIGPHATLIFEVELLDISDQPAARGEAAEGSEAEESSEAAEGSETEESSEAAE